MILPHRLQLFVQQYLKWPDSFSKITQSLDKCVVLGSRGQQSVLSPMEFSGQIFCHLNCSHWCETAPI